MVLEALSIVELLATRMPWRYYYINTSENQDTVVFTNVDGIGSVRRPFDGPAYFKIDLGNYPDAVGTGVITAPLNDVGSIKILNGGSGFGQVDPPDVIIRDLMELLPPKDHKELWQRLVQQLVPAEQ